MKAVVVSFGLALELKLSRREAALLHALFSQLTGYDCEAKSTVPNSAEEFTEIAHGFARTLSEALSDVTLTTRGPEGRIAPQIQRVAGTGRAAAEHSADPFSA